MSSHIPRRRVPRWLVWLGVGLVLALAAATVTRVVAPSPDVGQWRSAHGRTAYLEQYRAAQATGPAPTAVRDVPTRLGTVRAYGWTQPGRDASAHPVVLLPGISSGSPLWAGHVAAFTPDRDVWALDAVGDAGLSTQSVPMASFDDNADWVEDALSGLGLERVHLVGHSWGGGIAAVHAERYPARAASVALLEPAFTLALPPLEVFWWSMVSSLPVPQAWRDHALAEIGGTSVDEVRSDDPTGRMIALATEHYANAVPTPSPRSDAALQAYRMPVYVALADHKSLAGGAGAADRARTIPGSTVEIWPDTTHSLPFQAGDALNDRLAQWWTDAERRR